MNRFPKLSAGVGILAGVSFTISLGYTQVSGQSLPSTVQEAVQKTTFTSKYPIYFIGSQQEKKALLDGGINVSDYEIDNIPRSKHLLMVDNQKNAKRNSNIKQAITSAMSAGNPVIVFGNTKMAKDSYLGQSEYSEVHATGPKGILRETAYGYLITQDGERQFSSTAKNIVDVMEDACKWAEDVLSEQEPDGDTYMEIPADASRGASWPANPTFSRTWSSHDDWYPWGKLNIYTQFFKLQSDGSNTYDWWSIRVKQQSVPGTKAWPNPKNGWCTTTLSNYTDVNAMISNYFLYDYDPTTTVGSTSGTASVNIGIGSSPSVGMSWSYSITDAPVYDQGDMSEGLVSWYHDLDHRRGVGYSTYKVQPGYSVKVPNGSLPYNRMKDSYSVEWALYSCTIGCGTQYHGPYSVWFN